MVVIRIPIVARMRGDLSPMALRHSFLMNSVTSGGNLCKCALTLFLRMRPLRDRVGSSVSHQFVQSLLDINRHQNENMFKLFSS